MTKEANGDFYPVPIVDQSTRPGAITRLIIFIVVLTVAAIVFGIFRERFGDPFLLGMLGVLAMIGVGFLFATAVGFIQIAPRLNHQVHEHAKRYAATLANETGGTVPFINLNLEQVIEAVGWAGELDYAYALHDRYVNFWKLEPLIDEALRAQAGTWAIRPPRAVQPLSLLAKAA